jgi:SAM-dependent methyltransferase
VTTDTFGNRLSQLPSDVCLLSSFRPDKLFRMTVSAAQRWESALAEWAIPTHILEQATVPPWVHPPAMFRSSNDDPANTPSMETARILLRKGSEGSALDVGCGGGRSSLPLSPLLTEVIGVDEQQPMLDQFAEAAANRGVRYQTYCGKWPDIQASVPIVDVVVCHHVAYNVGLIAPFVRALSTHARVGVVMELPDRHPTSPLNSLWLHFWGIERPTEPSAALFIDVVRELGFAANVEYWNRPPRPAPSAVDRPALVGFVRTRLCLQPERDAEIDELLGPDPKLNADRIATVSWTVNES